MTDRDAEDPTARTVAAEATVTATPEQVWQAIATGHGCAAWALAAEFEAREGGALVLHRAPFGPDATATITAWEPPRRLAYEEPIGARDDAVPLATEILVEGRGGGTCVVRVVSSLPRGGEGWEALLDGAGEGWRMSLIVLRAYLTHFAGQRAAPLDLVQHTGRPLADRAAVLAAVAAGLGLSGAAAGQGFRAPPDAPALTGMVEHAGAGLMLLRATAPCPALVAISTLPMDGATLTVNVLGRLYGPDAAAVARRERPRWTAWLAERCAAIPATPTT